MEERLRVLQASVGNEERKRDKDREKYSEYEKKAEDERLEFQNIVIELQEKMQLLEEESSKFKGIAKKQSQEIKNLEAERTALEKQIAHHTNVSTSNRRRTSSSFQSVEVVAVQSEEFFEIKGSTEGLEQIENQVKEDPLREEEEEEPTNQEHLENIENIEENIEDNVKTNQQQPENNINRKGSEIEVEKANDNDNEGNETKYDEENEIKEEEEEEIEDEDEEEENEYNDKEIEDDGSEKDDVNPYQDQA